MNDLTQSWHDHQKPAQDYEIAQRRNAEAFDRFMLEFNRMFQLLRDPPTADRWMAEFNRESERLRDGNPIFIVYEQELHFPVIADPPI